jgi:hypothetical protein
MRVRPGMAPAVLAVCLGFHVWAWRCCALKVPWRWWTLSGFIIVRVRGCVCGWDYLSAWVGLGASLLYFTCASVSRSPRVAADGIISSLLAVVFSCLSVGYCLRSAPAPDDSDMLSLSLGGSAAALLLGLASAAPQHHRKPHYVVSQHRANAVKDAFQVSWDGYYKHAFPHDSLRPVTNRYADDRCVSHPVC